METMEVGDAEVEGDTRRKERFTLGEPYVLLSFIGLTFLNGITVAIEQSEFFQPTTVYSAKRSELIFFQSLCQTVVPVPVIIMLAFLSEIKGRKPIFLVLCALSLMTSILEMIPPTAPVSLVVYISMGIVQGGLLMLGMVTISEYCSPRHRFVYLIANGVAWGTGSTVVYVCVSAEVLGEVYFKPFGIVLGLVCAGCACAWPESPYWLAARGRRGDAARALRRLRGGDAARELRQLKQEHCTHGPAKLFWLSLLSIITIASVSLFSNWIYLFSAIMIPYGDSFINSNIRHLLLHAFHVSLLFLVGLASYRVKRKVIYVGSCLAALAFSYVLAVWLYVDRPKYIRSLELYVFLCICQILLTSGPRALSVALLVEIIPLKYNTVMACICSVFLCVGNFCFGLLLQVTFHTVPNYIYVLLFTTLAVPGVIVAFFLAPETKEKTLLEIQKSYIPKQTIESPEQGQMVLENV